MQTNGPKFDANPSVGTRGIFLDVSKAFDRVWHEGWSTTSVPAPFSASRPACWREEKALVAQDSLAIETVAGKHLRHFTDYKCDNAYQFH